MLSPRVAFPELGLRQTCALCRASVSDVLPSHTCLPQWFWLFTEWQEASGPPRAYPSPAATPQSCCGVPRGAPRTQHKSLHPLPLAKMCPSGGTQQSAESPQLLPWRPSLSRAHGSSRDPAPGFSWGRSHRQAPACTNPITDPGRSTRAALLPDKWREPCHSSAQTPAEGQPCSQALGAAGPLQDVTSEGPH